MSRVSLFVASVCALLLVNVSAESDPFGIMSPDGTYKHGKSIALECINQLQYSIDVSILEGNSCAVIQISILNFCRFCFGIHQSVEEIGRFHFALR